MSLRDYQIAAVDALRRELATGARRVLLVLPTGGGKTRTLGDVVRRSVDRGHRALWLAHRGELVDQAAAALAATGLRVGALSASAATDADPGAPVQVATIQTLLARGLRPEAHVIVADEAHHYVAATWRPLLEAYPHAWILGCTATPERGDGRGLGELYERLVVGGTVRQLTAGGYLCPAEVVRPPRKLRTGEIAQRPIDAYLAHAPGKRAVVFSRSVHHAREHAAQFAAAGYRAAVVTGETPWEERRRALDDLRAGSLHALVNVYVATEGFDVPEIECVILARGFGSAGGYLQCVGRALRPADGKDRAIVVDLVGTSYEHGLPDDDRQYSLDGRGIQRAGERADQAYCLVCGAPRKAGEPCAECGTEPAVVKERVVGAKLEKFAAKRAETVDQRIATLRRWYAVAGARGYRDGWVINKFKATYGSWPTAKMLVAARAA